MTPILHITARAAWDAARADGSYRAPSLDDEGFIHTSTREQVIGVANAFYAGQNDLVILVIDPARLTADLRWEAPQGAAPAPGLFPHIYGALNLDAVVAVVDLTADADGRYALPGAIA